MGKNKKLRTALPAILLLALVMSLLAVPAAAAVPAGAAPVALETTVNGEFAAEKVKSWYCFTTTGNYSNYSLAFSNYSVDTTVYVGLYDRFEQEIGEKSAGKGGSLTLDRYLEPDTTYYICLSRYSDTKLGNYALTVREKPCDAGNIKAEALPIALENKYVKALDVEDIEDWFSFTTTGNYSNYSLVLTNNSVDTTVYAGIYDEYDQKIGEESANKGATLSLDRYLEPDTTYYIRLTRYNDSKLGNYSLAVNEKPCDAGNIKAEALPIALENKYIKALDVKDIEDWFSFTTTGNYSNYSLVLTNNSVDTTVYAGIYDEYDQKIGEESANKGATLSLDRYLEPDTTYYIRLTRYNDSRLGNYSLAVNEKPCDAGNLMDEAFAIPCDATQAKKLDVKGIDDWFSFTAASETLPVTLSNETVDSTVYATVYDEFSKQIGKVSCVKGKESTEELTFIPGGTYYICVTRYYSNKLGNYQLTVGTLSEPQHSWGKASGWAEDWLALAEEQGLYPDCLIGQDMTLPINREEFASVAVRLYEALSGGAAGYGANPFEDTESIDVLKAVSIGITDGTDATLFSPRLNLSREQAATMLTRAYKAAFWPGWTLAGDASYTARTLDISGVSRFNDDGQISDYARASVYFMAKHHIIDGVDNNIFAPKSNPSVSQALNYGIATREQALKIAVASLDELK